MMKKSINIPILLLAALATASCSKDDAYEEGDYSSWTAGMVTVPQGTNTLYFVPTEGGMMFTMDRTDMTYEKLVQMNGGSISADDGGTGLAGVQTYKGDIEIPAEVNGLPVVAIDQYALSGNKGLTGIKIPESVKTVGSESFALCPALDSVVLPSQVTEIAPGVFAGEGVRKVVVPDGVKKISHFAFLKNTKLDSVKINPATSQITVIEPSAFNGCSALVSCPLPEGIQEVGAYAFDGCSKLQATNMPKTATVINPYQYRNCSSLTEFTIPATVTEIGMNAFYGCSKITTFNQSEDSQLKKIGYRAFYNNKVLTAFTLPEGLEEIGSQAFRDCQALAAIDIPEGITAIKDSTFYQCKKLATLTLPSTVRSLGTYAFYYNAFKSVTVPEGVTELPSRCFFYCTKLTDVTIPETVETLGDKAFANCTSLANIVLPASLKTMGLNVFYKCSKLKTVHLKSTVPPTLSMNLDVTSATYYIPKGSLEAYQSAHYWKNITNFVEE